MIDTSSKSLNNIVPLFARVLRVLPAYSFLLHKCNANGSYLKERVTEKNNHTFGNFKSLSQSSVITIIRG